MKERIRAIFLLKNIIGSSSHLTNIKVANDMDLLHPLVLQQTTDGDTM